MSKFLKPRIVISKCLDFDKCRYNGEVIPAKFVRRLIKYVDFIPICPEVEIGLGIPRDPIKIVEKNGKQTLIQPSTDSDLTRKMHNFSKVFLSSLDNVDGFILKASSPSCGIKDVKIYPKAKPSMALRKGAGLFAQKVLDEFPGLAIEDEGRLTNYRIREHFLTKIFLFARFRKVEQAQSFAKLVDFQTDNKFLFMAYNQTQMRKMGKIIGESNKQDIDRILREYKICLQYMFKNLPRFTSHVNVLMHGLGYFKKELTSKEKQYFLGLIEKYRKEIIPLSAVLTAIQSWIVKYDQDYLERQTYFHPFPEELIDITDSGKGRDGK